MNSKSTVFHGARFTDKNRCVFSVWAPLKKSMQLHLVDNNRVEEMKMNEHGYFVFETDNIKPGTKYFYAPDGGQKFPDLASAFQPDGVHGASAVINHDNFQWTDQYWKGLPFRDLILYE